MQNLNESVSLDFSGKAFFAPPKNPSPLGPLSPSTGRGEARIEPLRGEVIEAIFGLGEYCNAFIENTRDVFVENA